MSQVCPQCSQEVPDSFGLTTCQHCGFTFFPGLAATSDAVVDESSEVSAQQVVADVSSLSTVNHPHSGSAVSLDLFSMPSGDPVPIVEEPMSAESFQKEIQKFASEESAALFLTYRFSIQGIDTVHIRRSVLEVLSEPRLGLDMNLLPSQIRQGVLVLNKFELQLLKVKLSQPKCFDRSVVMLSLVQCVCQHPKYCNSD